MPYIGEIRLFAGNFAPYGWMFCHGQELLISQNSALFALIGTTYGGDGSRTFGLPDLQGRVPLHRGNGPGLSPRFMGEHGGTESVTLLPGEMPAHTHPIMVSPTVAASTSPVGAVPAVLPSDAAWASGPADESMAASSAAGGSVPHENRQPTLAMNYVICVSGGDFPTDTGYPSGEDDTLLGEVQMFGFGYAPRGWAMCNGGLMNIAQNAALFSLLGTSFGGNGQTTFGLPELRGTVPASFGAGPGLSPASIGARWGVESVTLTFNEMPTHQHELRSSSLEATTPTPVGNVPATSELSLYGPAPVPTVPLPHVGGGQAHPNMQPSLTLNYCIALAGIYPPRS